MRSDNNIKKSRHACEKGARSTLRPPAYTDLTGSIYEQQHDTALLLQPGNAFFAFA
jgi:hypothetical protein